MTLPPLPTPKGADTFGADYTAAQMESYARASIAAHVPEAAFGNIAAVPAQPVAWTHVDYLTAAEHARQNDYPFAISAQARGPTPTHDVPLYAAPQAVPVPAGWSVTYDGKRASYIYADQETAEFEAQQVGGTARAVAVYLAAAPKEQPHE